MDQKRTPCRRSKDSHYRPNRWNFALFYCQPPLAKEIFSNSPQIIKVLFSLLPNSMDFYRLYGCIMINRKEPTVKKKWPFFWFLIFFGIGTPLFGGERLNLDEVLALKGMGYNDEEILGELKKTNSHFPEVTGEDIANLRKNGLGEKVIEFILSTRKKPLFTLRKVKALSQKGAPPSEIIRTIGKTGLKVSLSLPESLALLREKVHPAVILALKRKPLGMIELRLLARKKTDSPTYMALIQLVGLKGKFTLEEGAELEQKGLPLPVLRRLEKEKESSPPPAKRPEIDLPLDQKNLSEGESLIKREKWLQALKAFSEAIKLNPKLAQAYSGRSRVYSEMGHQTLTPKSFDQGLLDANRALGLDPNLLEGYLNRARALTGQKKFSQALDDIKEVLQRNPKRVEAFYLRGGIRAQLKDTSGALKDYNHAIELNPSFSRAYASRGALYAHLQNSLDRGMADLNQAIKLNPYSGDIYFFRALIQLKRRNFQEALADLNEVLVRHPNHLSSYLYRATIYRYMNRFRESIADLNRVLKINPKVAQAYVQRAVIFLHLGQYHKSIDDFTRALDLNPKILEAYYGRGTAKIQLGDRVGALKDWEEFLRIAPNHPYSKRIQKLLEQLKQKK